MNQGQLKELTDWLQCIAHRLDALIAEQRRTNEIFSHLVAENDCMVHGGSEPALSAELQAEAPLAKPKAVPPRPEPKLIDIGDAKAVAKKGK